MHRIIYVFIIISSFTLKIYAKPKLLLFSYVPPQYVIEDTKYWSNNLKLDGFIIGNICKWFYDQDQYISRTSEIKNFNKVCKENGIDYNFLKISLGYDKFPAWNDIRILESITKNVVNIIDWAKQAGFYGICFDTEPYNAPLWDTHTIGYQIVSLDSIHIGISTFTSKVSKAIYDNNLELFIIPEGIYFDKYHQGTKYQLWFTFIEELTKTNLDKIIIGCEYTYKIIDDYKISQYTKRIEELFEGNNKIVLAYGAWPLGFYKSIKIPFTNKRIYLDHKLMPMKNSWLDKSPNYQPEDLRDQLNSFFKYQNEWIWIYSHGAAWWTLPNLDYDYIWNPENQLIPTDERIDEYFKILQDIK